MNPLKPHMISKKDIKPDSNIFMFKPNIRNSSDIYNTQFTPGGSGYGMLIGILGMLYPSNMLN